MKKNSRKNKQNKYCEFMLFNGESGYGKVISESRNCIGLIYKNKKILLDYSELAKFEIYKAV